MGQVFSWISTFAMVRRVCEMRLVLLFLFFATTQATESSKQIEGYPAGFLPDCPGSNKQAFITKKSLKELSFIVLLSNSTMAYRRYNYYQMEQLAKDPDVDFSKKTMVFAGGFISSPFFPFSSSMGKAYKQEGYNVFMLDTLFFTTMEYPRAARLMRPVGKQVAKMLIELTKKGLNIKDLELIGMSLGGQTISFIAKNYKELTGVSIAKLIALEPAGPCFRNLGPKDRLDKSDADFVIYIGTNIDGYGMAAPVGHVNFYVNGGEYQVGGMYWFFCPEICSHTLSFNVWIASLKHPDEFIAIQCDSVQQARNKDCFDRTPRVTNLLGPKTDRNKEGIFYLSTLNNYPYYMGTKGLSKENEFIYALTKSLNSEDVLKV